MAIVDNPYLTGNYAPVTEEVTAVDLVVTGELPEALVGRYLRNGPNPFGSPEPASYHWFTGDGMVHGIRLRGGRAEWYRNRWVRSAGVAEALGESAAAGPNPCRDGLCAEHQRHRPCRPDPGHRRGRGSALRAHL